MSRLGDGLDAPSDELLDDRLPPVGRLGLASVPVSERLPVIGLPRTPSPMRLCDGEPESDEPSGAPDGRGDEMSDAELLAPVDDEDISEPVPSGDSSGEPIVPIGALPGLARLVLLDEIPPIGLTDVGLQGCEI